MSILKLPRICHVAGAAFSFLFWVPYQLLSSVIRYLYAVSTAGFRFIWVLRAFVIVSPPKKWSDVSHSNGNLGWFDYVACSVKLPMVDKLLPNHYRTRYRCDVVFWFLYQMLDADIGKRPALLHSWCRINARRFLIFFPLCIIGGTSSLRTAVWIWLYPVNKLVWNSWFRAAVRIGAL